MGIAHAGVQGDYRQQVPRYVGVGGRTAAPVAGGGAGRDALGHRTSQVARDRCGHARKAGQQVLLVDHRFGQVVGAVLVVARTDIGTEHAAIIEAEAELLAEDALVVGQVAADQEGIGGAVDIP
ncbi:hypothetical protein D3C72_1254990 [compost metagenome]